MGCQFNQLKYPDFMRFPSEKNMISPINNNCSQFMVTGNDLISTLPALIRKNTVQL